MESNNRGYFNSESDKNRDMWKHSDGDRTIKLSNARGNMYANGKFDDVIQMQNQSRWNNAAGEEENENEDSFDPENEEAEISEEFAPDELPKFRQLVRSKKLELKAQYGKARFTQTNVYKQHCLGGWVDIRGDGKGPIWKSDINCSSVLDIIASSPKWVWGWRKRWREFKQGGGLAQLKMISKGMAPLVPPTTTTPNPPRGGGRKVGETVNLGLEPKLDTGGGTSQAGMGKNIVGTILILGLAFGAIKMMK